MINYAPLLQEAISSVAFPKASLLIRNFLRKHLGTNQVYLYPEAEHFISGGKHGVGIRFYMNKVESVRFNWLADSSMDVSRNLMSVDYWDGSRHDGKPAYHLEFDKAQSLVKTLPFVASFIKSPMIGNTLWIEETSLMENALLNMNSDFSNIVEAKSTGGNVLPTIDQVIRALGQGSQQKDMRNDSSLGNGWAQVIVAIRNTYPQFFEKQGASQIFINKSNANKISKDAIVDALSIGGVKATVTAGKIETYQASKEIETMEKNLPRLCFEEQLVDLRVAMGLLMKNSTNALYLAGRGGIGKTQTVEEELQKRGLTDGEGYFKITGSASTAGIYRILYEHRKHIILFDDSDGALKDVDSRNLFKAASDTKAVRKLSWMKAGKTYVDPDDMNDDDDGDDRLPRYFNFEGKIIFISNLHIDTLDPDGSLRTRGYLINIDPTDEEVYKYMGKIVSKIKLDVDYTLSPEQRQEVIDVLRSRNQKEGSVNLRQLVRGLNTMAGVLADGGTEWQRMVLRYA
jgi:hypothetical protein